ncbi:MAG: hypothetical protein WB952_00280 [Terriglobales bacterium]
MDRFKLNSPEQVEAVIGGAIEATKAGDVRRAVKALTKLVGVKLKMALSSEKSELTINRVGVEKVTAISR